VSVRGAQETGLSPGTPVVAGAGDQAAGSGVVFAAIDRPALDPRVEFHLFCHALPERWHVMGVTQAAGLSPCAGLAIDLAGSR